jgi:hypothetical protein
MRRAKFAVPILLTLGLAVAQPPLPELKTEATDGGSIFHLRNTGSQPLTGFLIELVNYPGSYYALWRDEMGGQPIAPGGEWTLRVANMTVGAVPEYVKLQAAIYADGAAAGDPGKVAQFVERRRYTLAITRELISRLEKSQAAGVPKSALIAEFRQWADTLPPPGRVPRASAAAVNQAAGRAAIGEAIAQLDKKSPEETLAGLRRAEKELASSKPAL